MINSANIENERGVFVPEPNTKDFDNTLIPKHFSKNLEFHCIDDVNIVWPHVKILFIYE